jgi:hypothetical protein
MKKFKQVDCFISIALILTFSIVSLINMDGTFIIGYLVVGGWQVISMIVHSYHHWFTGKKSVRSAYHWLTLFSLITMPVGSCILLLFIAPFMAIFYTWLCYHELYVKMQRPIHLLK